jgi:hypothetical protein
MLRDRGLGHSQQREGNADGNAQNNDGNKYLCEAMITRLWLGVKHRSSCPSREPREEGAPG